MPSRDTGSPKFPNLSRDTGRKKKKAFWNFLSRLLGSKMTGDMRVGKVDSRREWKRTRDFHVFACFYRKKGKIAHDTHPEIWAPIQRYGWLFITLPYLQIQERHPEIRETTVIQSSVKNFAYYLRRFRIYAFGQSIILHVSNNFLNLGKVRIS